jgi:hypothetical protein
VKHVYRIKNPQGTTIKRVGSDNRYTAKRLADGWAAALTRETGAVHYAEKVRNPRGPNKR